MGTDSGSNQPGSALQPWQTLTGVVAFLLFLVIIYSVWHVRVKGSVESKLSDEDRTAVTLLLNNQDLTDSAKVDKAVNYMAQNLSPSGERAKTDFKNQYGKFKVSELIAALPSISMESRSYFWLNTDMKYIEVIFWSIFGVLASLLYFSSESMRLGTFKKEELPVYWAKIFYAPLIALIIIFSFKLITSSGSAVFDYTSIEIIVFSFILGFFSGRAIELLNKIKDVILPGGKTEEVPAGKGILAGRISVPKNVSGLTAEKIKVTLTSAVNGGTPDEVETNNDGVYLFKNIKDGVYELKAMKKMNEVCYSAVVPNEKISNEKPVVLEDLLLEADSPVNAEEKKEEVPT